jgi:hypothetical protein
MRYVFPQPLTAQGNYVVSRFVRAIISGPGYRGYRSPTVAPEPFVKPMAGVVHSMGGNIGTHMSLWVPLWDLVVRPCG